MNSRRLTPRSVATLLPLVVLGCAASFAGTGCSSTVTPAPVESRQSSFDHGAANSGVLLLTADGAVITPRARARYNGLIERYGAEWRPALARDYGVTPQADGNFHVTNEALQKFIVMNAWQRMGRAPGTTPPPQ